MIYLCDGPVEKLFGKTYEPEEIVFEKLQNKLEKQDIVIFFV